MARQHVSQRQAVVSKFRHRPEFESKVSVGRAGIELKVTLRNDKEAISDRATIGDLVKWLFVTGTKPHVIRARIAKVLRFVVGGRVIFARFVQHPGFKAKPTLDNINKRLEPAFKRAIDRGFRIGFNRLK